MSGTRGGVACMNSRRCFSKNDTVWVTYMGQVLLDNRYGLVTNVSATAATVTAEREAALLLRTAVPGVKTVGADKSYDVASFVAGVRDLGITPHVAQKVRGSAMADAVTAEPGYAISQRKRKLIEQDDKWAKSIEVNLMGTVRTCRALVPKMTVRAAGVVVNTGSDLAKQPEPGFVDYGSCKAALLYLTKALAKQYARVRVNTFAWPHLVEDVDQTRRHCRSTGAVLLPRSRCGSEEVS
jgi:NAD(P)-dependent dehydrogenase (short-subunit alcohol dehydrogenase family)